MKVSLMQQGDRIPSGDMASGSSLRYFGQLLLFKNIVLPYTSGTQLFFIKNHFCFKEF